MTRLVTIPRDERAERGPALLAFVGPPAPTELAVMVACAANLKRELFAMTVGLRGATVLSSRRAVAVVATAAQRLAAMLVVVGGATPLSAVRQLVASTWRPVLIARTPWAWRLVLSATDLRMRGTPVVAAGAAVAARCRARAIVLHNVAPTEAQLAAELPRVVTPLTRRLRRLARVTVRTTPHATALVSTGPVPDRAIAEEAGRRRADLLVLGMRRPDGRRVGRCADGVITRVGMNVMVVPLGAPRGRCTSARDGSIQEVQS